MSVTGPARSTRGVLAAAVVFTLLVVVVYSRPLLTGGTFTGRDQTAYNLPMAWSIHDAYSRGRLPVWTPEISGGRPLLPNPNVGALYPLRAVLSRLSFPLAMRIYPVLHWAAAGVGMILLLRFLGASAAAAWVGAATYVFSGVGVSEVFFPHLQPGMTLLPWVLWRTAALRRGDGRTVVWLGLAFALDFLAGDVFTDALAVACAALWIGMDAEAGQRKARFLSLAGAIGLGLLAAAPQIVATALWIPETHRAVTGMNLAEATGFSLTPWRLLELVVPFPFGESWRLETSAVWGRAAFAGKSFGFFLTLYSGALAVVALFSLRQSREIAARFSRRLFLLAAVVAIVPSLMPRAWGRLHSPLPLRNPEKLSVALVFALAVLSALAFDACRRAGRRPRGMVAVALLLTAAAGVCALWPDRSGALATALVGTPRLTGASRQLPEALAEAALSWTITLIAMEVLRKPRRAAAAVACALLALPLIASNRRIPEVSRDEEVFSPTPFALRIDRKDPRREFRTLGESLYRPPADLGAYTGSELAFADLPRRSWVQDSQIFWRRGTLFNEDFDVGDLTRVESLRQVSVRAAGYRDSAVFFRNLGLRWGIRLRGQDPISGFRRFGGDPIQDWDEQDGALPDLRLATRWIEHPDAISALNGLGRAGGGDLVLETGRAATGSARPGRFRILEKSPERLRLEVEAADPTWLFVLRAFWSHRTVRVDGRAAETVPAYLALTAVAVPAGRHSIEWDENVPGGAWSRWGPVAAALIAAIFWRSPWMREAP